MCWHVLRRLAQRLGHASYYTLSNQAWMKLLGLLRFVDVVMTTETEPKTRNPQCRTLCILHCQTTLQRRTKTATTIQRQSLALMVQRAEQECQRRGRIPLGCSWQMCPLSCAEKASPLGRPVSSQVTEGVPRNRGAPRASGYWSIRK